MQLFQRLNIAMFIIIEIVNFVFLREINLQLVSDIGYAFNIL